MKPFNWSGPEIETAWVLTLAGAPHLRSYIERSTLEDIDVLKLLFQVGFERGWFAYGVAFAGFGGVERKEI